MIVHEHNLNLMLGRLNDSISNIIFYKTNRPDKMSIQDHQCIANNCDGPRFNGCSLTCTRCLQPKFIDCISDRTEIVSLMKMMNIIPDVVVNKDVVAENHTKLVDSFGPQSLFDFVCPKCKSEGSINDIKKKLDDKIKSLQKKNTELQKDKASLIDERKKLKEENDKLNGNVNGQCVQCQLLSSENNQMKTELVSLKQRSDEKKCDKCDESIAALNSLNGTLGSIDLYTSEISKTVDEQNHLFDQFKQHQNKIVDDLRSLNMCIPNAGNNDIHVTGNNSGMNQQKNSGMSPNSGTFLPRKSTTDFNGNPYKMPLNTSNNTKDANGNFHAPSQSQANGSYGGNKVLSVYVSKFIKNVQSDDIVAHILQKTNIPDPKLFVVDKLVGQREDIHRKTYVSFKITTLNIDVYNAILNNEIWAPNQSARPFDNDADKKKKDNRFLDQRQPRDYDFFNENNFNGNQQNFRNSRRGGSNRNRNFQGVYHDGRYNNNQYQNFPPNFAPPPHFEQPSFYGYRQFDPRRLNADGFRFYGNRPPPQSYYTPSFPDPRRFNDNSYRNKSNNPPKGFYNNSNAPPVQKGQDNRQPTSSSYPRNNGNFAEQQFMNQGDSDRRNFLEAGIPNQNPFRMNRDDYQYRSRESIYRA